MHPASRLSPAHAQRLLAQLQTNSEGLSDFIIDLVRSGEFDRVRSLLPPDSRWAGLLRGTAQTSYADWFAALAQAGAPEVYWHATERRCPQTEEELVVVSHPAGYWFAFRADFAQMLKLPISLAELAAEDQDRAIYATFRQLAEVISVAGRD